MRWVIEFENKKRRVSVKKISISGITATALVLSMPNISYGGWISDAWNSTKEATSSVYHKTKEITSDTLIVTHLKSEHLEDIDFETIYPKEFYKKSYFGWVITGVAVVGAGAFTYFTAGAGAPAAATGASAVATWVAGGGAGSYMAGLSMIGSWFGGNAILGAAILNGLSIGAIGGGLGAKVATMGILAKVGIGLSVTALGLDGIAYFKNPKTDQLEYRVRVVIPKDVGSKDVRDLVDKIYAAKEKIQDALENENGREQKNAFDELAKYKNDGIVKLRTKLATGDTNPEDLLVLGIIASNEAEYALFDKALRQLDRSEIKNMGFLYYLDALNSLYHADEKASLLNLQNSSDENKYALEPIALQINLLGYSNFAQNEVKIEELVKFAEDNFDSDDYATPLSMVSIYYRVGTLYFINGRYAKAQQYYEKAKDELGFLQKHFFGKQLKHTIELSIANAMHKAGKTGMASKVYNEIIDDIDKDDVDELKKIKEQYIGGNT
jgi:tetratricopeptide (TPR) repeat protein